MNVFHQGLSLRLSWAEDIHNQLSQCSQASIAPGLCLGLQQLQQHPGSSQLYLGATHSESLTTNVTAAWEWEEVRGAGGTQCSRLLSAKLYSWVEKEPLNKPKQPGNNVLKIIE